MQSAARPTSCTPFPPVKAGAVIALVLSAVLAGCAPQDGENPDQPGLEIAFEPVERPDILSREGPARIASEDVAGGLWAVVSGLRRAESGILINTANDEQVTVALFSGSPPGGAAVEISAAAAQAIGLQAQNARVRVTAIRSEPVLVREESGGWF